MSVYFGLELVFNEQESNATVAAEMVQANIKREIINMIEVCAATGGNVLEMIYFKYCNNQDYLDVADSLLSI